MYVADDKRYERMQYKRCGNSGLLLPRVSLGLWHNFGTNDSFTNQQEMIFTAFDAGITHFDIANNYGPLPGSAEENFGKILKNDLSSYRDELIISTKAGYDMWAGPYGTRNGSRKYLIASLDQSLKRLGLNYVDIFYHHCPDEETPLEETMNALSDIVKQGKALYVALSNYRSDRTRQAAKILKENGTPLLIHQPKYNMIDRWTETDGLYDTLDEIGAGSICFSPLAQGMLTDRYLKGIPSDSRATRNHFLKESNITNEMVSKAQKLNEIAKLRGQSLAQMALSWVLKGDRVTSVLIGASNKEQILDNCKCIENLTFTSEEIDLIDAIIA